MRENVFDRSKCHHDEGECRLGGVKAVGPIDDEMDTPKMPLPMGPSRNFAGSCLVCICAKLVLITSRRHDDDQRWDKKSPTMRESALMATGQE